MIETISTTKIAKCRKRHRCDDCLKVIDVGEPYALASLKDGGAPYRWVTCQYCDVWRDALLDLCAQGEDLGRGWVWDALDGCTYDPSTGTYEVTT
jgi:hypothetical protein